MGISYCNTFRISGSFVEHGLFMKHFLLGILILFPGVLNLKAQTESRPMRVNFLESAPVVDGKLDSGLFRLPIQHFTFTEGDNLSKEVPEATFRIAYGTEFLYLYAEVASDSLVCRDRGYQNGDGVVVVIGKPMPANEPTREFYLLGFTAQGVGVPEWQKKFVWYRNVDLAMTRLRESGFCAVRANHRVTMECLIPWSEVYPYHPWLSDEIGFNLMVVKGFGERDRVFYYAIPDGKIQSEQQPRVTMRLSFDTPRLSSGSQSYAILSRNNLLSGEPCKIRIATASSGSGAAAFRVILYSGEHAKIAGMVPEQIIGSTPSVLEQVFPIPSELKPGGYSVEWRSTSGAGKGTLWLTVLPRLLPDALRSRLEARKTTLARGSYTTLQFMIGDAEVELARLKPYETAYSLRLLLEEINMLTDSPHDLIAAQKGIFRRGFFSTIDSTFRPYTVRIPQTLQPGKRYPMVVYLHGSGQDDHCLTDDDSKIWGDEVILIAPNGRGTSNFYTADHAQEDIEEAVNDAIRNYPIDTFRILLAGFSMGGYGVYRTFWEHPSRYRALVVLSGSPVILWASQAAGQPDFLDDQYLVPFAQIKIFIFHGTLDRNIPIEHTRVAAEKLRKRGAFITFIEEPVGHEIPSAATRDKLREWVKEVLE